MIDIYKCKQGKCMNYYECITSEGQCVTICPLGCCCVWNEEEVATNEEEVATSAS